MNPILELVGAIVTTFGSVLIFVALLIFRVIYLILRWFVLGNYYAVYYATHPHKSYLEFLKI